MAASRTEILLVEDNANDIELTMRAFQRHQVVNAVQVVRDGVEALDYLFGTGVFADRDLLDVPKVVLLDLKLPLIDGIEVLRRLKQDERTRNIPIVVLTSSKEDRDVGECYRLGVNSYIVKPVDFEQFTEAARQLGMYWLLLNEPAS